MSRILLCVRRGAAEVPAVVDALHGRGAEAVVLDSAGFPTGLPLTLAIDRDGVSGAWPGGHARGITAVWQGVVAGVDLPAMAPGVRETCVAASESALVGLVDGLEVFQLDPHERQVRADNKPHQLGLAQRAGLAIPATIVSNDPEAVRAFARRVGPIIAKMLVQQAPTGPIGLGDAAGSGDGGAGGVDVVFTTALTEADLAQLDGLDLCPMIFQERVANRRDVRVTVVGRQVFAAGLDAAARGDVDWRQHAYGSADDPVWQPHDLPGDVADRIGRVVDALGLNYAAVDLIVRPDGRHVFLELNATGAFAFLGPSFAAPIAAAIAEVLIDPGARRPATRAGAP